MSRVELDTGHPVVVYADRTFCVYAVTALYKCILVNGNVTFIVNNLMVMQLT